MYKPLLILKYLRKRRIAWASLIAVVLCTAMVLVVMSVMGGWLRMFRASFQGLSGEVIVQGTSLTGFPHYEEMIERLEARPEVAAAVPTIETFGLVNINNQIRKGVQVVGMPIDRIGLVNEFPESLFLQHAIFDDEKEEKELRERLAERVRQQDGKPSFDLPWAKDLYRSALPEARTDVSTWPGMIVGTGVVGIRKERDGEIDRWPGLWPYQPTWVKLTTIAVDPEAGGIDLAGDKAERNFWIVDNSRTGVFQQDQGTVYVPLDLLQRDLRMTASTATDTVTGEEIPVPARVGAIHIDLADGVELNAGRQIVDDIVQKVRDAHGGADSRYPIRVETWEEANATFLQAVEKEKALVTFLFGMISLVAVFLIFCIFYMIVIEKTRDIGIVKSVGATDAGVAAIFLGYGGAIGLVGGLLGLGVGALIVRYINEIHTAMGTLLGLQIWSADTYMFDTIPNTINPWEAGMILIVAVVASVIGALIPAWRAARMDPVEALRFE